MMYLNFLNKPLFEVSENLSRKWESGCENKSELNVCFLLKHNIGDSIIHLDGFLDHLRLVWLGIAIK